MNLFSQNLANLAATDLSLEHAHASDTSHQASKIIRKQCIDIYQFMGDVCSTKLLAALWHHFRGPGKVVQIDESLFVHT